MYAVLRRGLALASASVLTSCGGEPPTSLEPERLGAVSLHVDAARIAFHACCSGDSDQPPFDVLLYDVDQSSLVPLPGLNDPAANDRDPAITNDGDLIAFGSDRGAAGNVFLYDVGSQELVALPGLNRSTTFEGNPSVNGNGRFIAFESNRSGAGNVFLYDRNTSALVPLPGLNSPGAFDGQPSISDDARFIAFFSTRSGNGNVFLYDRNRQRLRELPGLNSAGAVDDDPGISGDGTLLAFRSVRGLTDGSRLFVYHRHTGALSTVPVEALSFPREPALSPDGRLLLLTAFDPEADVDDRDVWAFDRATGTLDMLPDLNDESDLEGDGGPALNRVARSGQRGTPLHAARAG